MSLCYCWPAAVVCWSPYLLLRSCCCWHPSLFAACVPAFAIFLAVACDLAVFAAVYVQSLYVSYTASSTSFTTITSYKKHLWYYYKTIFLQYTLVSGEDLVVGLRSGEVQLWSLPTLRLQAVSIIYPLTCMLYFQIWIC